MYMYEGVDKFENFLNCVNTVRGTYKKSSFLFKVRPLRFNALVPYFDPRAEHVLQAVACHRSKRLRYCST